MSKIVVVASTAKDRASFIAHAARATGLGLGDIRSRLDGGRPLFETILFMNDHDEVERRLREVMAIADRGEAEVRFFELEADEEFSDAIAEQCSISADVLRNILDAHRSRRQARESGAP